MFRVSYKYEGWGEVSQVSKVIHQSYKNLLLFLYFY